MLSYRNETIFSNPLNCHYMKIEEIISILSTLHERHTLSPEDKEAIDKACELMKKPAVDWLEIMKLLAQVLGFVYANQ